MFKMKYEIVPRYLTGKSKRRPRIPMPGVRFMVAHDTGNPGSTAAGNVSYYERSRDDDYASAQIFVDDREIIECIPFLTGAPEKAWHVVYNVTTDNEIFGVDSNDCAGGVELCYGGNVDLKEAYKRYVWVLAYACYRFGLNPAKDITGHYILDPKRKVDPKNSLWMLGKTMNDFVNDVVAEYRECTLKLLDEGVRQTVSNTWITPTIDKSNVPDEKGYLMWLDYMLLEGTKTGLDKGVAVTIINTWMKPSYKLKKAAGDDEQANYIHWLADELRDASGLGPDE